MKHYELIESATNANRFDLYVIIDGISARYKVRMSRRRAIDAIACRIAEEGANVKVVLMHDNPSAGAGRHTSSIFQFPYHSDDQVLARNVYTTFARCKDSRVNKFTDDTETRVDYWKTELQAKKDACK